MELWYVLLAEKILSWKLKLNALIPHESRVSILIMMHGYNPKKNSNSPHLVHGNKEKIHED